MNKTKCACINRLPIRDENHNGTSNNSNSKGKSKFCNIEETSESESGNILVFLFNTFKNSSLKVYNNKVEVLVKSPSFKINFVKIS